MQSKSRLFDLLVEHPEINAISIATNWQNSAILATILASHAPWSNACFG